MVGINSSDESGSAIWAFQYGGLCGVVDDSDGSRDLFVGQTEVTDNTRYHIFVRFNAGATDVWVDGVQTGMVNDLAGTLAIVNGIGLGNFAGESGFIGSVQQVVVYNIAVADSVITGLYNGGTPISPYP